MLTMYEIILLTTTRPILRKGMKLMLFFKKKIVDEEEADTADVVAVLKMPMSDLQDKHVGFGSSPAVGVEEDASRF